MLQRKKRAIYLEKLKRIKFVQSTLNYNFLKFILKSRLFSVQIQLFIIYYFTVFYSLNRITIHKNICFQTSYKKSVNTFVKLNRMQAIQKISSLKLPGFSLAKW